MHAAAQPSTHLGGLERVPGGADADALVRADGAVRLAALPVPEPELALAVAAEHVTPVRREPRLARVACH